MKKLALGLAALFSIVLIVVLALGPELVDKNINRVVQSRQPVTVTAEAKALNDRLTIMDWHADTLLWDARRNMLRSHDYGHVDVPKLKAGNIALQMFTTVTKSPEGQNYEENEADSDTITLLAKIQRWPLRTWDSLLERALFQGHLLAQRVEESGGDMIFVRGRDDLEAVLAARNEGRRVIGALLGTEGLHPLEGKLENLDRMEEAGFRMFGLTHFFDNELGGSLHGTTKAGLTDFGRAVVQKLTADGMIIDLAHASEQMAWDALAISDGPFVVSHTGFKGHCETQRNFPDDLMKAIVAKGGLVAVGAWDEVTCARTVESVAASIRYGINLVGEDNVVLGSDWDGATEAIFVADQMAELTAALLNAGLTPAQVEKVMGGNSVAFLRKALR
ncbi:dipeptidase [Pseudokordiimonas caeni]|uniref:dipeptidase n=1 Tax=Pseudokordiimonas caeni TaxID=2997908 RepID=UPI002810E901|nr:dipeptidase [Pseudokordiimonas caeni]